MRDAGGRQRKIIIFSEHRDTLNYLQRKIAASSATPTPSSHIHGGTHRDERRSVQALFRSDPEVRVLIATDAAGEGVNLQNANLMVNYDLPWNPNRLEQRFGRIHRIGQQEVCHLWNLVAKETREGEVYHRLLEKLRVESEALKGRVFDILGEVFEGTSLQGLLLEAIRYGDRPEVRARLSQKVDAALDHSHLRHILERNALAQETMSAERLFAVKGGDGEGGGPPPAALSSCAPSSCKASSPGWLHLPARADRFEVTHVPASVASATGRSPAATAASRRRSCALRAPLLHQGGRAPPRQTRACPSPRCCTPATPSCWRERPPPGAERQPPAPGRHPGRSCRRPAIKPACSSC
jgi:hypothetical protein